MRTFGIGIFDNDRAQQVRQEFEASVAQGHSAYVASDKIIAKHGVKNEMEVYLALAELQIEHEIIQPKVKKKALTLIISGDAAEDWESAGSAIFENRKAVLQDLRKRLLAMPT
jgi:hypothetical protein